MLMTLIKNGKVVAKAMKGRNLFTLDLATSSQAMSTRVMSIRKKGHPTYLVSKNK